MKTLQHIIEQRDLSALFQPIMDLSSGAFLGFEGLIRGPANSSLHSPINLFAAAKQQGLSLEVEMLCRQVVLESFAAQKLPGKLFLNVSPEALTHPSFKNGQTLGYLEKLGIDPKQVIIEITENQPTFDLDGMRNALLHYKEMGFQTAIDDLGEGFSSLRLWSELRPEFVKVDMHFVQGINADPLKQQFLRSIQQIAQSAGTLVIAEGIETEAELRTICDLGIAFGQGYFIARPNPTPALVSTVEVSAALSLASQPRHAGNQIVTSRHISTEKLLRYVEPVHPDTPHEKIFARFSEDASLRAIPVVKNGLPVGLIERQKYIACFVQPFRHELLSKKPCATCMGGAHCKDMSDSCINAAPLLVEKSTPIHELSEFLTASENDHFSSGFVITEQGRYIGLGNALDLLREITKMQIENARYANPLTLLPGNVPINEHIEHLLHSGEPFTVCYCDIDHFKPFNDVYGYRKGDEAIQFTGRLLNWACDPRLDLLGHIGGDDFIMIMRSADWEKRCNQALTSFAHTSSVLFEDAHRAIGGYLSEDRQGRIVRHPLPTLSIGVVCVAPGAFRSHHEISEAATIAKKMAKKTPGNSLFVERRETAKAGYEPLLSAA
ncbi:MAG: GGDEF domain-containing protein [Gallionella sp.]|jgi:diguanylate cyclase (GGDEF)-like protein|nr:GGDEF domain-containing protein [Gallionella sp.]MCK9352897.1 GGDEF domain-containing protein [Gallionella sp.]